MNLAKAMSTNSQLICEGSASLCTKHYPDQECAVRGARPWSAGPGGGRGRAAAPAAVSQAALQGPAGGAVPGRERDAVEPGLRGGPLAELGVLPAAAGSQLVQHPDPVLLHQHELRGHLDQREGLQSYTGPRLPHRPLLPRHLCLQFGRQLLLRPQKPVRPAVVPGGERLQVRHRLAHHRRCPRAQAEGVQKCELPACPERTLRLQADPDQHPDEHGHSPAKPHCRHHSRSLKPGLYLPAPDWLRSHREQRGGQQRSEDRSEPAGLLRAGRLRALRVHGPAAVSQALRAQNAGDEGAKGGTAAQADARTQQDSYLPLINNPSMKKVYDWDVKVRVSLPDYKRTFSLVLSVHTNAHQVCLKAAQLLGYDEFTSTLALYCPDQHHPVNPIETLFQHGVKDGDTLSVKLVHALKNKPKAKYHADNQLIGVISQQKYNTGVTPRAFGLVVEGLCQNARCVNYGKDVEVPLGSGEFDFFYISSRLKCPVCPNRDQFSNPSLIVKLIQVVNCLWKLEGEVRDKTGLVVDSSSLLWQKAAGDGSKAFMARLKEKNWVRLKIAVKPL